MATGYSRANRVQKYKGRAKEIQALQPPPKPPRDPQAVGFWYNAYEDSDLPMPQAHEELWEGQHQFLTILYDLESVLMSRHREYVEQENLRHLLPSKEVSIVRQEYDYSVVAYRGSSQCRCCGQSNGSHEYRYLGWTWPEGYFHYLSEHNVRPDEGFKHFILSLKEGP